MIAFLIDQWQLVLMALASFGAAIGVAVYAWRRDQKPKRHPDEPEWTRDGEDQRGPWGNDKE